MLKKGLSELEQKFMNVIWKRENATASDIRESLAHQRPLKDSTVRTVLARLEAKGYVRHVVEGRTFVYSGAEHPRNVAVRAVKQIVDRFCNGSVESLLTGMVDGEIVDPDELKQIAVRLSGDRGRRPVKPVKRGR